MTNKQAIEWLVAIKEKYIHGGDEGFDELRKEALDMAVKSLEEERPQGEWIITGETDEFYGRVYKCTHCGKEVLGCDCRNFCTWCGAAMRKEK